VQVEKRRPLAAAQPEARLEYIEARRMPSSRMFLDIAGLSLL
jgi:hypothetical protein